MLQRHTKKLHLLYIYIILISINLYLIALTQAHQEHVSIVDKLKNAAQITLNVLIACKLMELYIYSKLVSNLRYNRYNYCDLIQFETEINCILVVFLIFRRLREAYDIFSTLFNKKMGNSTVVSYLSK